MRDSQQEQSADIRESGPAADVADDAGLIRGDSGEGGFAAKKTPNSFLYFIQCTGPGRPIKIGHTKVVERRLSALQMGCPWALVLIGHVAVEDGAAIEEQLHRRFARTRVRGEWFAATAELLDLAERVDRHRVDVHSALLGGTAIPPVPPDLIVMDGEPSAEPEDHTISADVARVILRIRQGEAKRLAAVRESRRTTVYDPSEPTPGRGEFMWRGKIRKL